MWSLIGMVLNKLTYLKKDLQDAYIVSLLIIDKEKASAWEAWDFLPKAEYFSYFFWQ